MLVPPILYKNLRKNASDELGKYTLSEPFKRDLYFLRNSGFIEVNAISRIPPQGGNLSAHIRITSAGRQYIQTREVIERSIAKEKGWEDDERADDISSDTN